MIDSETTSIVQEVIRRESRSFLQYLGDSLPWPTSEGAEVDAKLRPIINKEREAIADLYQILNRNHIPLPYLGSFPSSFTTANFSSLQFLAGLLIEEERRLIADLEKHVALVLSSEARALLIRLLETKRRDLQELENISISSIPGAAALT